MAKLLLDYTVLDNIYQNGLFCFFQGDDGSPVKVQNPLDTGTSIIGSTDSDPVVFSYMGGPSLDEPRALVCIITTDFSTGLSTGLYSVAAPATPGNPVSWSTAGLPQNIQLLSRRTPVAGNPYGVVQVGNFLYILDYDTTNIYTIDITRFEATTSSTYPVDAVTDVSKSFPAPVSSGTPHGAALISLSNNGTAYLYGLYNFAQPPLPASPTSYDPGAVVRLTVDTSTGALTLDPVGVTVGLNTQGLVPAFTPQGSGYILVPAIGGIQQAGTTNGTNSTLYSVSPFGTSLAASVALTGDAAAAVAANVNFDIKSLAVSDDGIAYLLVATNDANYNTWWRLFKAAVVDILAAGGKTLDNGINAGILTQVDAGYGSPEYYWEVLYENSSTPGNGRLWFVRGTPIRVSVGSDYDTEVLFDTGVLDAGSSIYPTGVNVNSADLIGEMIYQYNKGASIDTRLIKGREAAKATAAAAAKAASAEEEEK